MTTEQVLRCDICGIVIPNNQTEIEKDIFKIKKEKVSKYRVALKYDSPGKKKDLCFKCAKEIRDYFEALKLRGEEK